MTERKLKHYQETAIHRGMRQNLLIAFGCGMGKSITGLAIAALIQDHIETEADNKGVDPPYRPTIIVTKKKAKAQWKAELLDWGLANEEDIHVSIIQRAPEEVPPLWVVVHYEELVKAPNWIFRIFASCVIVDESHYIKNHKSGKKNKKGQSIPVARTEAVKRLKGMRKILLSATPSEKDIDYFSQLNYLEPNKFPSFWKFTDAYFVREFSPFTKFGTLVPFAASPQHFADEVLTPWVMFQDKDWQRPEQGHIKVEMSTPQLKAYNAAREADDILVNIPLPGEVVSEQFIANTLARISLERKLASCPWTVSPLLKQGAKLDWLEEWAESIGDASVVVLAENRATVVALSEMFLIPAILGGGTDKHAAEQLRWLKEAATSEARGIVGCGTIAGLGEAIDLPHVDILIFLDYNWSSTRMQQAADRHDRLSSLNREGKQVLYVMAAPVDYLLRKCVEQKWTRTRLAQEYWSQQDPIVPKVL